MKYLAYNGRVFDKQEDCEKYEAAPHVYIIFKTFTSSHSCLNDIEEAFITRKGAEMYIASQPEKRGISYGIREMSIMDYTGNPEPCKPNVLEMIMGKR
jgi:hypothetical protein